VFANEVSTMNAALLADRGVVKIAGDAARDFLQGLFTADVKKLTPGAACFAALLTPQGKVIADFMVVEAPAKDGGGFFLDVARGRASALVERLNVYKLRAKVIIEDLSEILGVLAGWGGNGSTALGLSYPDPRLPELGIRIMLPPHLAEKAAAEMTATLADASAYDTHRIALGIPSGGVDFQYGDAFPHETDMDQLGGIDFAKGCYVGQEVVSRMEHRGTARTRAVPVRCDGDPPPAGTAILAGERQVGTIGSSARGMGIALLRLDRTTEALERGETLTCGGIAIHVLKPDWARFAVPGDVKAPE